jgi:hypothetical protein
LLVCRILVSVGVRRERYCWFRSIWKCWCDALLRSRGERDDIDAVGVYFAEYTRVIGLFPTLSLSCLFDLEIARNRW